MIKNRYLIIYLFAGLIMFSCKTEEQLPELDLMSYGLPISIKAPEGAEIEMDDLGIWKDLTIKHGEDYFVQVIASKASTLQSAKVKDEKLVEVKGQPFFSKVIQEDENGFIFEKQIDENTIDYDFRHILIQGDQEYIFQTGLYGTFSEEEVRSMYKSVSK